MGMAELLSRTQRFSVNVLSSYDAVQPSGQRIEFGDSRTFTVSRPDRMRVEAERSDGHKQLVLFDGKAITAYSSPRNVYARISRPGNLVVTCDRDAALDDRHRSRRCGSDPGPRPCACPARRGQPGRGSCRHGLHPRGRVRHGIERACVPRCAAGPSGGGRRLLDPRNRDNQRTVRRVRAGHTPGYAERAKRIESRVEAIPSSPSILRAGRGKRGEYRF